MRRFAVSFLPLVVLSFIGGCDCAGDTGIGDAGDAPSLDAGDTGPRPDSPGMRCGNALVEGTEECDDGNADPDDGCFMCELECGDGRVSGTELCDTGIAAGMTGACPTGCDDGVACTTDSLDGADCQTSCVHGDITMPADDDTCCPPGANASTDNDCPGTCGDGLRTGTESCDTAIPAGSVGSCPTSCDDGMACTTDALTGAGTCDAACSATPITAPMNGDGCCPTGATIATDDDCGVACGDGVLSMGETCDTGITSGVGSCPTACDDGAACTADMLMGAGTCNAICGSTPITMPVNGDGCCPAGATMATDTDCTGRCGDGILQSGESCDTAIAAGMMGACPTSCNDGMACTADMLSGAGTCAAACSATPITMPRNGDGCCPAGATIGTDNDCPARCGDAVVSAGETCDTAIASGMGACPTMCSDGMVCTTDMLTNAGTCTAACAFPAITMPVNGDGCCPPGATIGTDNDCPARCGDRVVTAPETCDDGNMTSGDGCSATCMLEMSMLSAFRFESLVLRDPHAFARVLFCIDITDQLNTQLSDAITMDTDMPADGQLNLSIAQIFNPLVRTAGSSTATYLSFPDCSAPMSSTSCTLPMGGTRAAMTTAMNLGGTSVCLAPLAGTVRPYSPAVISPTAGGGATCYIANGGSVTFTLAGIPITLTDAQIGGEWRSATQIGDGLIRGFLSEADANAAIIPASVAVVGGMPLSAVLRGGMGNCASGSDMDTGPGGVRGWYMYLNFTARLVPYTEL